MAVLLSDDVVRHFYRETNLPSLAGTYTLMAWVYLITDTNTYGHIFKMNDNGGHFCHVGHDNDGVTLRGEVNDIAVTGTTLSIQTWYHIALVRAGVTNYKVYLNGVEDISVTEDVTGNGTAIVLCFGEFSLSSSYPADIRMSAIKFYEAALTPDEIKNEMNSVLPKRTANLNGWYPCLPGTPERARDYSGNGNNLTEEGTITDADPPPVSWGASVPPVARFAPSVVGLTGVRINASNEMLVRTTDLPTPTNFTICGWVKATFLSQWSSIFNLENSNGTDYVAIYISNSNVLTIGANFVTNPTENTWFFVAITNAGIAEGDLKGYWKYADTVGWNATQVNQGNDVTPAYLTIGNDHWSTPEYINAAFFNIKIWNAVLSSEELLQEAQSILPKRTNSLYSWTPMFSGAEERIKDYSGNGRNWTEPITLTEEAAPPVSWGMLVTSIGLASDQTLTATAFTNTNSFGAATVSIFPITGILDNFNRANEDPINTNWDGPIFSGHAELAVINNQLAGSASGDNCDSYWNTLFSQNQEIFVTNTVVDTDSAHNWTLQTRINNPGTASLTGYLLYLEPSDSRLSIYRTDNGTNIKISDYYTHTFSNGHKYKFRSDGDQHVVFIDTGSGWVEVLRDTDATYVEGGYIGAYVGRFASTSRFDDLGGGDGIQYLTATAFVNSSSFGAATISQGGTQTLTATIFTASQQWGTHTVYRLVIVYPTSDIAINGWTDQAGGVTNLYTTIDDLTDTEGIKGTINDGIASFGIVLQDPGVDVLHSIFIRYQKEAAGTVNLTVRLRQGVSLIASWEHLNISETFVTIEEILTGGQIASITDYSALRVEVEVTA